MSASLIQTRSLLVSYNKNNLCNKLRHNEFLALFKQPKTQFIHKNVREKLDEK